MYAVVKNNETVKTFNSVQSALDLYDALGGNAQQVKVVTLK